MINWKLRFQNKVTLTALIAAIVSLGYKILAVFHVVPPVAENDLVEILWIVVDILVIFGVVNDPTTSGLSDSLRAKSYKKPNNEK